ncbi:MAG: hypothetical protein ABI390_11245 [Daejeonella sp.]
MNIKNLYCIVLSLLLFASCQSDTKDPGTTTQEAIDDSSIINSRKSLDVPYEVVFNDSTRLMEIKKNPEANSENLNENDLIEAINLKYPEIILELISIKGDTIAVKIKDATYLTQRMGSEGAKAYLAEATFALTELKNISAVDFQFTEGDHASPGVMTRADFNDFN